MYWEPLKKLQTRFRDISQLKNISAKEVEISERCIDLIVDRLQALDSAICSDSKIGSIRLTIGLVKENVDRRAKENSTAERRGNRAINDRTPSD